MPPELDQGGTGPPPAILSVSGRGDASLGEPADACEVNAKIPLPAVVVDALNEHLARSLVADDGLVFTLEGSQIHRPAFGHIWRPAAVAAGLTAPRTPACTPCGIATPMANPTTGHATQ